MQTSGSPCLRLTLGNGIPVSVLSNAGRRRSARSWARLWNGHHCIKYRGTIVSSTFSTSFRLSNLSKSSRYQSGASPGKLGSSIRRWAERRLPSSRMLASKTLKRPQLKNVVGGKNRQTWTVLLLSKWTVSTTSLTALRNSEALPMTGKIIVWNYIELFNTKNKADHFYIDMQYLLRYQGSQ